MTEYSDLEHVYRLEKNSPALQSIPEDFYADVLKLAARPDVAEHRGHILEILTEIFERRRSKIVLHAARTAGAPAPLPNALKKEFELYHDILDLLESNRKSFFTLEEVVLAEKPKEEVAMKRVRLLQAIPVIIGSDSVEYGPYKADEVVELPADTVKILVEKEMGAEA